VTADVPALIAHFGLKPLPVEGTLYVNTYLSAARTAFGDPAGTAIVGLFAREPRSYSCFHRLAGDEIWHVYGGDPFRLILLHEDGTSEDVLMGGDVHAGQRVQYTVPAGTYQAGDLIDGSRYALYGCTMTPGFTAEGFEVATADELIAVWPERAADIAAYAVRGEHALPPGFTV
jgi:predicted cupin superfamily sugar epimerase